MQYTKLGKSGMTVSKVCLGTMRFGSQTTEEEAFRIMDKALEMGINFFDVANVYGGEGGRGKSEEIIGKWFQARSGSRAQVVLATKIYNPMGDRTKPNEEPGRTGFEQVSSTPIARIRTVATRKKSHCEGSPWLTRDELRNQDSNYELSVSLHWRVRSKESKAIKMRIFFLTS